MVYNNCNSDFIIYFCIIELLVIPTSKKDQQ